MGGEKQAEHEQLTRVPSSHDLPQGEQDDFLPPVPARFYDEGWKR